MKFEGMCVKALPFPHFHEPKSLKFPVFIQHSFFIQFLTLPESQDPARLKRGLKFYFWCGLRLFLGLEVTPFLETEKVG